MTTFGYGYICGVIGAVWIEAVVRLGSKSPEAQLLLATEQQITRDFSDLKLQDVSKERCAVISDGIWYMYREIMDAMHNGGGLHEWHC